MNYALIFRLTPREAEALRLAEAGLDNRQVAAAMGITSARACNLLNTGREKMRTQSTNREPNAGTPGASSLLWNARNRQPHISGHVRFRAL